MEPRVRRWINIVWGILLALVIVDHVTGTSYRFLLRKFVHADVSLYIEITSMIFTMGVPFFYSLYKRRENQLEEEALQSGGGIVELEAARGRNDLRCILYYSLMAGFVVLLVFVQSSIINASKAETAGLEQQLAGMRQSLQMSNEQIREMNSRLGKLESILQTVATQDQRTRAALQEIAEIRSITKSIDSMMTNAQHIGKAGTSGGGEVAQIAEYVQKLDERMSSLEATVGGPLAERTESLARDMETLLRLVKQVQVAVQSGGAREPNNEQTRANPADLSESDVRKLREWIAKYVQDFEASTGTLGDPDEANRDEIRPRFQAFLRRQGEDLASFKAKIGQSRPTIRKALKQCEEGRSLGFSDCYNRLKWLLLLLDL